MDDREVVLFGSINEWLLGAVMTILILFLSLLAKAEPPKPKPSTKLDETSARLELLLGKKSLPPGKTIFLIDKSGSMKPTWDVATPEMDRWITFLPVTEASMVLFSDATEQVVPFQKASADFAAQVRAQLTDRPADGFTDIPAALRRVDNLGADTIVVFTDGRATRKGASSIDVELFATAKNMKTITHWVGVGNYERKKLVRLAGATRGGFIGR